jgi:hypothetical protein
MIQNKFGELVFSENDLCDLLMQGHSVDSLKHVVVDSSINLEKLSTDLTHPESVLSWKFPQNSETNVADFHASQQSTWHMPDEYKNLDIAQHILDCCRSDAELQRCGQELLLFQERDLFNLLRYLKYLVDTMITNQVIWGVGRGSSVASFVLYKLGVHRIDSLYYNLDIHEFLR